MGWLGERLDLLVAGGLIAIAAVLYILSRIRLLPKKSLPFVAGALLAVLGIGIWRAKRTDALREELKRKQKELEALKKRADTLRDGSEEAEQELRAAIAEGEREREALMRNILRNEQGTEVARERVDALPDDQLLDEFMRAFPAETPGRNGP